jgi:uncharacterized protein YuzE
MTVGDSSLSTTIRSAAIELEPGSSASGHYVAKGREMVKGTGYPRNAMNERFAYYDRDADIAWLPTGSSDDVVSEEVGWGLVDHDATSDAVVAVEVWAASKVLPADLLARLPAPATAAA